MSGKFFGRGFAPLIEISEIHMAHLCFLLTICPLRWLWI
jgi:hypothetical protein